MKSWTLIFLLTTLFSLDLKAQTDSKKDNLTIVVDVMGINNIKGNLQIALYSEDNEFPSDTDILEMKIVPVLNAVEQIKFKVQSSGKYAIAILHDISKNGAMDFNFVGYPLEPYGFSNNPGIWYREPTFMECAFQVSQDTSVKIDFK